MSTWGRAPARASKFTTCCQAARLEALVAREVYGLDVADDWQRLTGTFTYGSGDTRAELDEIITRSREPW